MLKMEEHQSWVCCTAHPVGCCDIKLKTASIVVLVCRMIESPFFSFLFLWLYFTLPDGPIKEGSIIFSIFSALQIPSNFLLLFGTIRVSYARKLPGCIRQTATTDIWLCASWVLSVSAFTMADALIMVTYLHRPVFLMLEGLFFLVRGYSIFIVWTYCLEMCKEQEEIKNLEKGKAPVNKGSGDNNSKPGQEPHSQLPHIMLDPIQFPAYTPRMKKGMYNSNDSDFPILI